MEVEHPLAPLPLMKMSPDAFRNKENEPNRKVKPEHPIASKEGKQKIFRLFPERKSKNSKGDKKDCQSEEDALQKQSEEDPVISLLESRNMQRVRFCEEEQSVKLEKEQTTAMTDSCELDPTDLNGNSFNIKSFMGRILYKSSGTVTSDYQGEQPKYESFHEERESYEAIVWETPTFERASGSPEVVHTTSSLTKGSFGVSFIEDPLIRAKTVNLLEKGQRAQLSYFQYKYALKCYVNAHKLLSDAKYPDNHQLLVKALRFLNNAHHILNCLTNSAKIVKMGIKYEEAGDLVKALKMYTIAYRIRRDQISSSHPSLLALLNILGSIQIKRGELQEAMRVYDLALKESHAMLTNSSNFEDFTCSPSSNLIARAVTFREMGTIHDKWGNAENALKLYHKSLTCISEWRQKTGARVQITKDIDVEPLSTEPLASEEFQSSLLENLRLAKSFPLKVNFTQENGIEILLGDSQQDLHLSGDMVMVEYYNSFFYKEDGFSVEKASTKAMLSGSYVDVDVSLTLHQIAQTYKRQGEYGKAIDAYKASLRGMKNALGDLHPNVAAVLGNIGNLQKELGDLDGAYYTYQEVLGIESCLLGVSHPEVAISLHNVATIEAYRGNHETSIAIYRKVLSLQKKLFGDDTIAVATTSASMGDVHERIGDLSKATKCYEESLRAKTAVLGRHNIEIARLFHKLGKIAFARRDYNLADSYTSRAVLIYRLNKIPDDHEWIIACERDLGDIDGAIALGAGKSFQC
eukprot:CAMPEP_0194209704 /NCGR_PEP_ID=MMETSP0156-20130528/7732_1 /TAXON_ID=33649 /ORGANISM="Thalassionema nitzschioides, Strain L26-B" /LENGTH=747 /DNA_ID=CAMNT_0038936911 /DNA_START=1 /DNA_END=2244 /DNA_ORIENTATION=-